MLFLASMNTSFYEHKHEKAKTKKIDVKSMAAPTKH